MLRSLCKEEGKKDFRAWLRRHIVVYFHEEALVDSGWRYLGINI